MSSSTSSPIDSESFKTASPSSHFFIYNETSGFTLENKQSFSIGRLWRQYQGTSYDIESNAKQFLKELRGKTKVDVKTLETAIFVKKSLTYVMHKRAHLPNSTLKTLSKEIKNELLQLVHKLASLQKISELQFCCLNHHESLAIEFLNRGARLQDAHGHYDALLAASYKKKNFPLSLALVKLGAKLGAEYTSAIDELLEVAITNGDERAALLLIAKGPKLDWKNAVAKQSHLHLATQAGLAGVVSELLKRGAAVNELDTDQNSAFHIACFSLEYEIALLLLKAGANAAQKNSQQKCGLALALGIQNNHAFFSNFFQPLDIKRDLIDCPPNSLEAAFLLQDHECGKKFAEKHSKKEFLSEADKLKKKYKATSFDFLTFCHLALLPIHFEELPLASPERDISLDGLLSYCETKRELEKVSEFIRRIEKKIHFRGTPAQGNSAITHFYQSIEYGLKHILLKQTNPSQKRELVREIVDAVDTCGGRYFTVVNRLYRSFCLPSPRAQEEAVHRSLADLREYIVVTLLDGDVSKYNYFVRMRGRELGIPGATEMQKFIEQSGHVNILSIEHEFYKTYTPQTIYEWIKPVLESLSIDATTPEAVMNYLSRIGVVRSVLK
jgi:hypothetical protein